jgi:hypothetical protein
MSIQVFDWPHLFGYHVNATLDELTPSAEAARVYPTTPECVWCGDLGVPPYIWVPEPDTDYLVSAPTAEPVPFSTVFLLFADEADALASLPGLAAHIALPVA